MGVVVRLRVDMQICTSKPAVAESCSVATGVSSCFVFSLDSSVLFASLSMKDHIKTWCRHVDVLWKMFRAAIASSRECDDQKRKSYRVYRQLHLSEVQLHKVQRYKAFPFELISPFLNCLCLFLVGGLPSGSDPMGIHDPSVQEQIK